MLFLVAAASRRKVALTALGILLSLVPVVLGDALSDIPAGPVAPRP